MPPSIVCSRYDASKAIRKVFRENNITVAYEPTYDRFPPNYRITNMLNKAKMEGRSKEFYILCVEIAIYI